MIRAHDASGISVQTLMQTNSLEALGEKLTTEGPHKIEGTPRRVRGLLGGKYIFDTTAAKYVWEHPYCASIHVWFILVQSYPKSVIDEQTGTIIRSLFLRPEEGL
jgi:hypothetical protein